MSGSSPESGEFAARDTSSSGSPSRPSRSRGRRLDHYREQAHANGWEPAPEDVLYRVAIHVAETDAEAMNELVSSGGGQRRGGFATSNKKLDDAAAAAGYYGRDTENQRARLRELQVDERIEAGQLVAGSPETVHRQITHIRDELGAGVLDLMFAPPAGTTCFGPSSSSASTFPRHARAVRSPL